MSLHDNSLLVYTVANTFYHFLIVPTEDSVELKLCGSISFEGVVAMPGRVRAMSWLIPLAQKSESRHLFLLDFLDLELTSHVLLQQDSDTPRTISHSPPSSSSSTHLSFSSVLGRPREGEEATKAIIVETPPSLQSLVNPRRKSSTTFKSSPIGSNPTGPISLGSELWRTRSGDGTERS